MKRFYKWEKSLYNTQKIIILTYMLIIIIAIQESAVIHAK